MTSRRSFFKRLASIVAVVALAPEIAFGRKLEAVSAPELDLQELFTVVYDLARSRKKSDGEIGIEILTDSKGVEAWNKVYGKQPLKVIHYDLTSKKPIGIYEQLFGSVTTSRNRHKPPVENLRVGRIEH